MIRLELPHTRFMDTYLETVEEFRQAGSDNPSTDHYLKFTPEELRASFQSFVQKKIDNHNNIQKEGWVQCTEFWIIDDSEGYCGRISLRHRLDENLFRYGGHIGYDIRPSRRGMSIATQALGLCLKEAKKIGIDKVLLTCDDDNLASIRVIEKNGGVLQDRILNAPGLITRRYWVSLD